MKDMRYFLQALRAEMISDKPLSFDQKITIGMEVGALYTFIRHSIQTDAEFNEDNQKQSELKTVRDAVGYLLNLQDRLTKEVQLQPASSQKLSSKPRRVVEAQTIVESSTSSSVSSSSSSSSVSSTSSRSSALDEPRQVKRSDDLVIKPISQPSRKKKEKDEIFARAKKGVSPSSAEEGQRVVLRVAISRNKGVKSKSGIFKKELPKSPLRKSATPDQIQKDIDADEASIATTSDSPNARPRIQRQSRFKILSKEEAEAISSLPTKSSSSSSTTDTNKEHSAGTSTQENAAKVLAGRLPTGQGPDKGGNSR